MVRITKNPDERRNEILDTAHQMFMTMGFEETAVSDIVKRVGVAQGTFYYYFKSKEELLDAITNKIMLGIQSGINDIVEDQSKNAVTKIEAVLNVLMDAAIGNESLADYVHKDKNVQMHQKIANVFMQHLVPVFTRIIIQGNSEKLFCVDYPEETANFIIYGLMSFHDDMTNYIFHKDVLSKKLTAFGDLVCRCLGAEKGVVGFPQYGG